MATQRIEAVGGRRGLNLSGAIWLLVILVALTLILTSFSSELPDGLEAAAEKLDLEGDAPALGMALPGMVGDWVARVLGVLLAALAGWLVYVFAMLRRGGDARRVRH